MLGAETAAALAVMAVVLMAYLITKVHLESKQNAREHAELREAINSLREVVAGQAESIARLQETAARQAEIAARQAESTDRRFDSNDRRFDSMDRKLDLLLIHLLKDRSDKDD